MFGVAGVSRMKKTLIAIGGILDLIFINYVTYFAIREWIEKGTFAAAFGYFILLGIWCCSMSLVRIATLLEKHWHE